MYVDRFIWRVLASRKQAFHLELWEEKLHKEEVSQADEIYDLVCLYEDRRSERSIDETVVR